MNTIAQRATYPYRCRTAIKKKFNCLSLLTLTRNHNLCTDYSRAGMPLTDRRTSIPFRRMAKQMSDIWMANTNAIRLANAEQTLYDGAMPLRAPPHLAQRGSPHF